MKLLSRGWLLSYLPLACMCEPTVYWDGDQSLALLLFRWLRKNSSLAVCPGLCQHPSVRDCGHCSFEAVPQAGNRASALLYLHCVVWSALLASWQWREHSVGPDFRAIVYQTALLICCLPGHITLYFAGKPYLIKEMTAVCQAEKRSNNLNCLFKKCGM
jgi:hypothetical protein